MNNTPDKSQKARIGILTFHRAVNYGAVLQAYALKSTLDAHGCNARVIDYRNPDIERAYGVFFFGGAKSIRNIIAGIANIPVKLIKNYKFRRFCRRLLSLDPAGKDTADLRTISGSYDAFVTGSDQVWHHGRSGFDKAYFLDFASVKKYSYAASFGFDKLEDKYYDSYKQLLHDYERISVREAQGAEIVRDLLCSPADVVLDPTLMLDNHSWLKVAEHSTITRRVPSQYILLYVFELTPSLREFTCALSANTGLKIVWIQASMSQRLPNTIRLFTASPEDFVTLMANATYVVTNSFHGTAFAINFEKDFYTELLPAHYGVNSRIEHLLNSFGLTDRLVGAAGDKPADYSAAKLELERQRKKSIEIIADISGCRKENGGI